MHRWGRRRPADRSRLHESEKEQDLQEFDIRELVSVGHVRNVQTDDDDTRIRARLSRHLVLHGVQRCKDLRLSSATGIRVVSFSITECSTLRDVAFFPVDIDTLREANRICYPGCNSSWITRGNNVGFATGVRFSIGQNNEQSFRRRFGNDSAPFLRNIFLYLQILRDCLLSADFFRLSTTYLGFEKYPSNFASTFRLFGRRRLQLMIPMSLFAGYEKIIKSYDYTTAYVGCTDSVSLVIYVHFLGCLASSQMSLSLAPLVELTSLRIVLAIAASTHLILLLVLLLKSHIGLIGYYAMSALWGLASSTCDCLLYVLYGMLSPGEELEAYCHLGFWYSIGASVNLILTRMVSVSVKLWTAFVCSLLAAASAIVLPYIISYIPKKVGPINTSVRASRSGSSGLTRQGVNDTTRKTGVYFGKNAAPRRYLPAEVKSISTSRIHRIAIPKTRPRFERHDGSNEDIETSI